MGARDGGGAVSVSLRRKGVTRDDLGRDLPSYPFATSSSGFGIAVYGGRRGGGNAGGRLAAGGNSENGCGSRGHVILAQFPWDHLRASIARVVST